MRRRLGPKRRSRPLPRAAPAGPDRAPCARPGSRQEPCRGARGVSASGLGRCSSGPRWRGAPSRMPCQSRAPVPTPASTTARPPVRTACRTDRTAARLRPRRAGAAPRRRRGSGRTRPEPSRVRTDQRGPRAPSPGRRQVHERARRVGEQGTGRQGSSRRRRAPRLASACHGRKPIQKRLKRYSRRRLMPRSTNRPRPPYSGPARFPRGPARARAMRPPDPGEAMQVATGTASPAVRRRAAEGGEHLPRKPVFARTPARRPGGAEARAR